MAVKNRMRVIFLVSLLVLSLSLTACGQPGTTPSNAAVSGLSGSITLSGSNTVQPLAEILANAFTALHPRVRIVVQGGGSSVGIKAVNDGTVDLGSSSRELTASDPKLVVFPLARDGIAVIVNPQNPVNNLSKIQIRDIYSGKITRWSQVNGTDQPVTVVAREEGSGTRTAFEEMIMGDQPVTRGAILQSSNGALLQVVRADVNAIGFISFGFLADKSVKGLSIDGVEATLANARSGAYPVVRALYFLTKTEPTGLVKDFLDFCAGPEAQKLITSEGYVSVH
ncbi:MAG TPA: phosphate ABC transporter substrate-binding protein [Dehalococcoidales bacterium]|nr:phosphate ABC transporter substrate-binding protein [Dehalococcoidales bacterium]